MKNKNAYSHSFIKKFGKNGLKQLLDVLSKNDSMIKDKLKMNIEFITPDNHIHNTIAYEDETLIDIVERDNLLKEYFELACDGISACSTCHIIFIQNEYYKKLEKPDEQELDMLDLAYEPVETSRLGCQVKFKSNHDNIKIKIPNNFNNLW